MRLPIWQGIVRDTAIMEMLNLTQIWFSSALSAGEIVVFCRPNLIEEYCIPLA
jgi:hypothetical protein